MFSRQKRSDTWRSDDAYMYLILTAFPTCPKHDHSIQPVGLRRVLWMKHVLFIWGSECVCVCVGVQLHCCCFFQWVPWRLDDGPQPGVPGFSQQTTRFKNNIQINQTPLVNITVQRKANGKNYISGLRHFMFHWTSFQTFQDIFWLERKKRDIYKAKHKKR